MKLGACGIELAKAVFQLNGFGLHGSRCLRKRLRGAQMLTCSVKFQPCLIGMEAMADPITGPGIWAKWITP